MKNVGDSVGMIVREINDIVRQDFVLQADRKIRREDDTGMACCSGHIRNRGERTFALKSISSS